MSLLILAFQGLKIDLWSSERTRALQFASKGRDLKEQYDAYCMDYILLLANIGVSLVIGGIGTFFWRWLLDRRRDIRIDELEDKVYSLDKKYASAKGVEAREEQAERMAEAMAEAAALAKEGVAPADIAKRLIPKYPDIALKLGKKYLKLG